MADDDVTPEPPPDTPAQDAPGETVALEVPDSAEATTSDGDGPTEAPESVEEEQPAELVEPVEPGEPAELVEPVEPGEPAELVEPVEPEVSEASEPRVRPRWQRPRYIAAATAGFVLVASTAGFAAVNHYSSAPRQVDVFTTVNASARPAPGPGVTLLIAGTDRRAGLTPAELRSLHVGVGRYGPTRPDALLMVHISESGKDVSVISLPRASYVEVPTYVDSKGITNTARKNLLSSAYAIGGAPLLIRTVENATGVHIDHYLEVDLAGFLNTVDALGGVPVCTNKPLADKLAGLRLPAGTTVVSGRNALAYVRASLIDDDFGRMARQQRFLASVLQKATSPQTVLNPIALNAFLNAAMSSITTDAGFGRDEILTLASTLRTVDENNILFFTVPIDNPKYLVDIGRSRNQIAVLWSDEAKEIFGRIAADRPLLAQNDNSGEATPVRIAPARVRVKVYNAAGTSGLGRRVSDDLAKAGYQVIGKPLNAKTTGATTTVIEYDPGFDQSLRTLKAAFPGATTQEVRGLGNTFVLLVGSDYTGVLPVTVSAQANAPSGTIGSPTKLRTAADAICV